MGDFLETASKETVQLLKEVAEEEGFKHYTIKGTDKSAKGDNFLGNVIAIRIQDTEKQDKVLDLIVKTASKSDAFRNQAPIADIYGREIYLYKVVFPTFTMLEKDNGFQPTTFVPRLYKKEEETLILENLKEGGFKIHDRRVPMDDAHVSMVMARYGHLHALSFALKNKEPNKFKNICVQPLDDIFTCFVKQAGTFPMVKNRCEKAKEIFNPDIDKEVLKTYQSFIDKMHTFFEELPEATDDYSVVIHGDGWTNNMLFKYQDHETKPIDMRFIDFQMARLAPAPFDLSYFIYSCASKEIISNLDYYLKVYYESFSLNLKKFGGDPEKMYPFSKLQEHWRKYARYGLALSLILIHVMLSEKDETIDLSEVADSGNKLRDAFDYKIGKIDEYNDRARHIILHFVENGFLL